MGLVVYCGGCRSVNKTIECPKCKKEKILFYKVLGLSSIAVIVALIICVALWFCN